MNLRVKIRILLLSVLVLSGCQSFPSGEQLSPVQDEYERTGVLDLSTPALYKYYQMCRAAWKPYDAWENSGWRLIYYSYPETETQWLFIPEGNTLYVIFRSSRALQQDSVDFHYNRRFFLRTIPFMPGTGIRAHHGFIEKYMSVRNWFLEELDAMNAENIVLVGHSAGAAMVSLVFMDLKTQFPERPLNMITFGMARIFNSRGAKWYSTYSQNVIRVVNGRDLFPGIPPAIFGFRHIGRLIRIGERPLWPPFSMKDHHPGYQRVFESLLRGEGIEPASLGY